jgi:hypothetical protein
VLLSSEHQGTRIPIGEVHRLHSARTMELEMNDMPEKRSLAAPPSSTT